MRRIRTAAAVLVVATLMSGCGAYENFRKSDFAKQDIESIVDAANDAMKDVTAMRVTGQVHPDGNQILIDLAMDEEGHCTGTMRFGGSHLAIRRIGERAWVKGDGAFYSRVSDRPVPNAVISRLSTSWVPLDDPQILELCELKKFLKSLKLVAFGGDSGAGEAMAFEEDTTADGDRVVMLAGRPGEVSWVKSDAPHHVLRVDFTGTGDDGSLALSEFNQAVRVRAPRPKDVFTP